MNDYLGISLVVEV